MKLNGDHGYLDVFPPPIFLLFSMGALKVSSQPQVVLDKVTPSRPFFTLAADSLNQIIITVESKGLFKGFQVGSHKVIVSHLQFADDTDSGRKE